MYDKPPPRRQSDIQTRVEQIVSAQVPERIHSSAATHVFTTVRGDGRCMVSAVQQGILGLSEYRKVARDERGVPLGEETADAEQQQSHAAVQRVVAMIRADPARLHKHATEVVWRVEQPLVITTSVLHSSFSQAISTHEPKQSTKACAMLLEGQQICPGCANS